MIYKGKSHENGWWLGVRLFQETTSKPLLNGDQQSLQSPHLSTSWSVKSQVLWSQAHLLHPKRWSLGTLNGWFSSHLFCKTGCSSLHSNGPRAIQIFADRGLQQPSLFCAGPKRFGMWCQDSPIFLVLTATPKDLRPTTLWFSTLSFLKIASSRVLGSMIYLLHT